MVFGAPRRDHGGLIMVLPPLCEGLSLFLSYKGRFVRY